MGCASRRVKVADLRPEQKWDFISLNDFKSTSCFEPLGYAYLWVSLFISTAVYAVDTFTAVNLIAFNRWSGEIQPFIPLFVSKWIFSGCIIASWVNLGFEHLRAFRVMRRGAVAECYLDNLAVRLECIRFGQSGRGWRRFLVFAELTKSKKGVEYVALFTYFSFQSWIRVIFCQGPRQVINALTLYSVYQAKLTPTGGDVGHTLLSFFKNIGILAEKQHQQAVILSGMVFTLVIWVFSALSIILAILFYLLFLWHYLPTADGGLTGYCERKINNRLKKIVSAKVNKAIEDEEKRRAKAEAKVAKKVGEKPPPSRQATVPTLLDTKTDPDHVPDMPMLHRQDTMATLPQYTSRPGTPSGAIPQVPTFELDKLDQARPMPGRSITGSSYSSNAGLVNNASTMGYGGRPTSPAPSLPAIDTDPFPGPQRTHPAAGSQNSQWQRGPPQGSAVPPRMFSPMGPDRGFTASPLSYSDNRGNTPGPGGYPGGPPRSNPGDGYGNGRPMLQQPQPMRSNTPMGQPPGGARRPGPGPGPGGFDPNHQNRIVSPAPSEYSGGRPFFNPHLQQPPSNQGRSSPAPGSEYSRRPMMDPYAQGRASPAPSMAARGPGMGQGGNNGVGFAYGRGSGSSVGYASSVTLPAPLAMGSQQGGGGGGGGRNFTEPGPGPGPGGWGRNGGGGAGGGARGGNGDPRRAATTSGEGQGHGMGYGGSQGGQGGQQGGGQGGERGYGQSRSPW